jgi:hypothetical protein
MNFKRYNDKFGLRNDLKTHYEKVSGTLWLKTQCGMFSGISSKYLLLDLQHVHIKVRTHVSHNMYKIISMLHET